MKVRFLTSGLVRRVYAVSLSSLSRGVAQTAVPTVISAELLFSLQRHHRTCQREGKKEECRNVELQVWNLLDQLPDSEVEKLPKTEVAEVLDAWCYFSRFWERGMNGPAIAGLAASAVGTLPEGMAIVKREETWTSPSTSAATSRGDTPIRRADPLDEILEF